MVVQNWLKDHVRTQPLAAALAFDNWITGMVMLLCIALFEKNNYNTNHMSSFALLIG